MNGSKSKMISFDKLFMFNSLLIMGLSAILIYGLAYNIFLMESPFVMLGGLSFLPVISIVVSLQYRAAFKADLKALDVLTGFLITGMVLVVLSLSSTVGEMVLEGDFNASFAIRFSSVCVAILAYFVFCLFLNVKRKKGICKGGEDVEIKVLLRGQYIALLFILVFSVGSVFGYLNQGKFEYGENVAKVDWLPETASNISYYKSYFLTAYEFSISEGDFLELAKKKNWDISEIKEPVTITRYNSRSGSEKHEAFAMVLTGYVFEHRQRNGGGVLVVFDPEKQRAYYESIPR